MSLAIETKSVSEVLLADKWHLVSAGTFDIDAYEFVHGDAAIHKAGASGVCAMGFRFLDSLDNRQVMGPLTSILAVRCTKGKDAPASRGFMASF